MARAQNVQPCELTFEQDGKVHTVRVDLWEARLGSRPDNEVVVVGPGVAPLHAWLQTDGRDWTLWQYVDLEDDTKLSPFVSVNDTPGGVHRLRDGDTIRLGSIELRFSFQRRSRFDDGPTRSAQQTAPPAASPGPPAIPRVPATQRGDYATDAAEQSNNVDCTVFAPPTVGLGETFMVQVFAHTPEEAGDVARDALEFDEDAQRRGVTSLGTRVAWNSKLTFELRMPHVSILTPIREIVWRGPRESTQFVVEMPEAFDQDALFGTVDILQDSTPIGQVTFKLKVGAASRGDKQPTGEARRYSQAFISYASKDRAEVLRRVQMLKSVGINFFQDVLNLEPGDRWAQELYRHIDDSDVLFLFWSTAAKESEWVAKEWQYALEKKGDDFIRPVGIEGPPIPAPPQQLQHLHFGDPILYFMRPPIAAPATAEPASPPSLLSRTFGWLAGRKQV